MAKRIVKQIEKALSILIGAEFRGGWRAVDMLTAQFGPLVERTGRRGVSHVGRFALHVQGPWRLLEGSEILVASEDRFARASTWPVDRAWTWDAPGANRWDERMGMLRDRIAKRPPRVTSVEVGIGGAFVLTMTKKTRLEAFVVTTEPEVEHWRLFEHGGESHFVVVNDENGRLARPAPLPC